MMRALWRRLGRYRPGSVAMFRLVVCRDRVFNCSLLSRSTYREVAILG
jgi:hypothetical protein